MKPTKEVYTELQGAYDFYNQQLFGGTLPECLITYQRMPKTYGYFASDRFQSFKDIKKIDEIAINPNHFKDRPLEEVLSTLAHEMVHLWQKHFGKPSRSGYHNKQWAENMLSIGLRPTDNGTETGKMTGNRMNHLIVPGGRFDTATKKFIPRFNLGWFDRWADGAESSEPSEGEAEGENEVKIKRIQKRRSKTKYSCPGCKTNVWGKPELSILCGECQEQMEAEI